MTRRSATAASISRRRRSRRWRRCSRRFAAPETCGPSCSYAPDDGSPWRSLSWIARRRSSTLTILASARRPVTQACAVRQFERHPEAAGLRWWSTLEASWINVTLFDRALRALTLHRVRPLRVDDAPVVAAAAFLGLA